jgi:hypothetical protein
MKKIITLILIGLLISCQSPKEELSYDEFLTKFEKSWGTETPEYKDVIKFYKRLDNQFENIKGFEFSRTDSGEPLHVFFFNVEETDKLEDIRLSEKLKILVNNGIHPGESDGIDASMMLLRDLAFDKLELKNDYIVGFIPLYNIGGALNRNSHSRTNQNGPEVYGFRGNARNFDLNRDFIKADTKNAQSFAEIFHAFDPDVFIDNHVSNGADYQYKITHLLTQHNKMGGELGDYIKNTWQPQLEEAMVKEEYPITPYVNVFGRSPDQGGFSQFMDYPRYSTGYTTLFNSLGMMVETHMLKPYDERVMSTYVLMKVSLEFLPKDKKRIKSLRKSAWKRHKVGSTYPLNFTVDRSKYTAFDFLGYQAEVSTSTLTGQDRLTYNQEKPITYEVKYFDFMKPISSVQIPKYYIVPKGKWKVIERLKENKIRFTRLVKDTTIQVESYRIDKFQTRSNAYEGHYPHYNTQVSSAMENIGFKKGDLLIPTQQKGIRYLLETLEPEAVDSFFNWNYFDAILQQKEGFSPYVFEEHAIEYLNSKPELKAEFEDLKSKNEDFASNAYAQLNWIHKRSPYYEKAHMRYPIYRIP